jgi:hypothetical protein
VRRLYVQPAASNAGLACCCHGHPAGRGRWRELHPRPQAAGESVCGGTGLECYRGCGGSAPPGMHLRTRGAVHLRARGRLRLLAAQPESAMRHARRAGIAATRARGGGASAGAAQRQRLRAMPIAHVPRR